MDNEVPSAARAAKGSPIVVQFAAGKENNLQQKSTRSNPALADAACGMIPLIGTIVAVGPVELDLYDTTYQYIVIRKEDGTCRDFAEVHAIPALSGLMRPDTAGTFLFLDDPDECRVLFVYREDGVRAVDYDAVYVYLDRVVGLPFGHPATTGEAQANGLNGYLRRETTEK